MNGILEIVSLICILLAPCLSLTWFIISIAMLNIFPKGSKGRRIAPYMILVSALVSAVVIGIMCRGGSASALFAYISVPTLSLYWFVESLIKFIMTPKDSDERKSKLTSVILSAIVTVLIISGIVSIVWLLSHAVANM